MLPQDPNFDGQRQIYDIIATVLIVIVFSSAGVFLALAVVVVVVVVVIIYVCCCCFQDSFIMLVDFMDVSPSR